MPFDAYHDHPPPRLVDKHCSGTLRGPKSFRMAYTLGYTLISSIHDEVPHHRCHIDVRRPLPRPTTTLLQLVGLVLAS